MGPINCAPNPDVRQCGVFFFFFFFFFFAVVVLH